MNGRESYASGILKKDQSISAGKVRSIEAFRLSYRILRPATIVHHAHIAVHFRSVDFSACK